MFASYHNHPEVASALIDAGCEINAFGTVSPSSNKFNISNQSKCQNTLISVL
jgi:hypothetical protein